jgi:predicted  nucleic acid-binding Zn-ribbon protein
MEKHGVKKGILAVYERPENLSLEFDPKRLQIFEIHLDDYENLLLYVNRELDKFREDLERLKENPLLSEQDFLPVSTSLITLASQIVQFENQLSAMKEIEQKLKNAKKTLFLEMVKTGVKSWTSPNGTKITRVDEVPASVKKVMELDTEALKRERPDVFACFCREIDKNIAGKSGYVKITVK